MNDLEKFRILELQLRSLIAHIELHRSGVKSKDSIEMGYLLIKSLKEAYGGETFKN